MIYYYCKRKYINHHHCAKEDTEDCTLWSACDDCYYHESKLICPFCEREIPNKEFLFKNGCRWCQQKGVKNE
jgi:hypothetical protein